jgi:hypothetical protein
MVENLRMKPTTGLFSYRYWSTYQSCTHCKISIHGDQYRVRFAITITRLTLHECSRSQLTNSACSRSLLNPSCDSQLTWASQHVIAQGHVPSLWYQREFSRKQPVPCGQRYSQSYKSVNVVIRAWEPKLTFRIARNNLTALKNASPDGTTRRSPGYR